MTGLAWWGQADALTFGLLVTVLAVMVWRLGDGAGGLPARSDRGHVDRRLRAVPGSVRRPAGQPGRRRPAGAGAPWSAVVLSDTGGYVAGVLLGRHPMAPSVSPKKSWEGFAGSLVRGRRRRSLLLYFLLDVPAGGALLFGLAVVGRRGARRPGASR